MKWLLYIDDFDMYRQPQNIEDVCFVEAPTAADAITIGQVRHNFPYQWVPDRKTGEHDHRFKSRKLKNIDFVKEGQ